MGFYPYLDFIPGTSGGFPDDGEPVSGDQDISIESTITVAQPNERLHALSQIFEVQPGAANNLSTTRGYLNAGIGPHEYWMNYDELNYSPPSTTDYGAGISRYMAARRLAPAPLSELWATIEHVDDSTGLRSALAGRFTVKEMDITCAGADDIDGAGARKGINIVGFKYAGYGGTDTTVSSAIEVFSNDAEFRFHRLLSFPTGWTVAGIDFSQAFFNLGVTTGTTTAIKMTAGMTVAWGVLSTQRQYWDNAAIGGAGAMHFTGNMRVDGTVNLALPVNAANDGAAASAGVAVGSVYRNGSVLMVRAS